MNDKEAALAKLHDAVTQALLQRVVAEDVCAADINAAINHLKSNGIDCSAGAAQGQLLRLAERLPFQDPETQTGEG